MNTVPSSKRSSVLFCDALVTGSAELKGKGTAGNKVLRIEWAIEVSLLANDLPAASEGWKEWALGPYPLHQPRFPVESREFPALHAPFLKGKAHTWSCPELRTGNRGNRRVPHCGYRG